MDVVVLCGVIVGACALQKKDDAPAGSPATPAKAKAKDKPVTMLGELRGRLAVCPLATFPEGGDGQRGKGGRGCVGKWETRDKQQAAGVSLA